MGNYKWEYQWVSSEPFLSEVKEELKTYFEIGAVDDGLFPSYVDHCLKKIGLIVLEGVDEMIQLKNGIAILPNGVVYLNDVLFAGSPGEKYSKLPVGRTDYQQIIECIPVSGCSLNDPDNPITYKEVRIVEKTTNHVLHTYDQIIRLKPATLKAKNMCESSIFKKFYDVANHYDVNGKILSTNLRNGELLIRYKRTRVDENGYPLVPDHVTMQDLISYYVRYKLFEQLWNTVTDETYNQIQGKMQYYEQKYNESLIIARTEMLTPSFEQQKEQLLLRRNKFRRNYNIR